MHFFTIKYQHDSSLVINFCSNIYASTRLKWTQFIALNSTTYDVNTSDESPWRNSLILFTSYKHQLQLNKLSGNVAASFELYEALKYEPSITQCFVLEYSCNTHYGIIKTRITWKSLTESSCAFALHCCITSLLQRCSSWRLHCTFCSFCKMHSAAITLLNNNKACSCN